MTDYGHDLLFGTFITPMHQQADAVVAAAQLSEQAGLDLVTFQDHPYQPRFLDTWTLLSYLAARTQRIRLAGNVLNLPLRQPAVLARSVASLDILSGGRVELGLGAGAFWEAIVAMGGRRLAPSEAVAALGEAIDVIRMLWDTDARGGARYNGTYYQLSGAKRGPAPVHDMSIWLGAYKPRMLRLIGGKADGWLPSLGYLQPGDLAPGNRIIDEAALAAGRNPTDIRRLLNVLGRSGGLSGPPAQWVEELTRLALEDGISAFILAADDPSLTQVYGQEIAPAVREAVDRERRGAAPSRAEPSGGESSGGESSGERATAVPEAAAADSGGQVTGRGESRHLGVSPTSDSGRRLSDKRLWDEATRPHRPEPPPEVTYTAAGRQAGQHLIDVHDHLRKELDELHQIIVQVRDGALEAAAARSAINQMTMRQNNWTMGAYCASYCRVVTQHHGLEDVAVFPYLRRRDPSLPPVLDRLTEEHQVIHKVLDGVDAALVHHMSHPDDFTQLQEAIDVLTDTLLSHLAYEEQELIEPLARHGFYTSQLG